MTSLITLNNVTKSYLDGENENKILDNVSLQINKAEFIAIVGESGSGKTTLLNILSLIDNNFDGQYFLENSNVQNMSDEKLSALRRDKIGFVFQDFMLLPNLNIEQNIGLQSEYQARLKENDYQAKYIDYLLESVDLLQQKGKYPNQLSGGQKQRVAIARSLFNNADIIVADEPTGALDKNTGKSIMDLLKRLNKTGKTIIFVTHDLELANYAQRKFMVDHEGVHEV